MAEEDVIGSAVIRLEADSSKLKADLEALKKEMEDFAKKSETSGDSIKDAMSGIAAKAAAAGITYAAFKELVVDSIKEFADAETASTKLGIALKMSGEHAGLSAESIKEFAYNLQETSNVSDDTAISAAALLTSFKRINDPDIFKDTLQAAADLSSFMGTDFEGEVKKLGKALDDPATGFKTLRDSGINFTEAQKDTIKSLQDSGNILAAQKIILQEVKEKFDGTAATMKNTFNGQVKAASLAISDMKENFGNLIVGALSPFIPKLAEATAGLVEFTKNLSTNKDPMDENKRMWEVSTKNIENYTKRLKEIEPNSKEAIALQKEIAKWQGVMKDAVEKNAKAIKEHSEVEKEAAKKRAELAKKEAENSEEKRQALKKANDEALKYIESNVNANKEGEEKIRAEYEETIKHFSGKSKEQAEARKIAKEKMDFELHQLEVKSAEETLKQLDELEKEKEKRDKKEQKGKEELEAIKIKIAKDGMSEIELAAIDHIEALNKIDADENMSTEQKLEAKKLLEEDYYLKASQRTTEFYDKMKKAGEEFASAAQNTLTSVFEDGLSGNLKNAEDYLNMFKDAAIKIIAKIAAEWVIANTLMADASKTAFADLGTSIAESLGISAAGTGAAGAIGAGAGAAGAAGAAEIAGVGGGSLAAQQAAYQAGTGATAAGGTAAAGAAITGAGIVTGGAALVGAYAISQAISMFGASKTLTPEELYPLNTPAKLRARLLLMNAEDRAALGPELYAEYKDNYQTAGAALGKNTSYPTYKQILDAVLAKPSDPNYSKTMQAISNFANGGIMTAKGPLPLKQYSNGGIADSPQMAVFGEGSTPEAYVPLPDGKSIPVTMRGGGGDIVLMLDGQVLGRVLNGMSKQGRLSLDPISIRSAYAI